MSKAEIVKQPESKWEKWSPGMPSPNPFGRPGVGKTVAETFRKFLNVKDTELGRSRLKAQMQTLYEISIDKTHKQCVQAAIYCQTRAYGNIPNEIGESALAAILLKNIPTEHAAYIASLAYSGNGSMLVPLDEDDTAEETENEDTEEVNE